MIKQQDKLKINKEISWQNSFSILRAVFLKGEMFLWGI
jgi:hypothetical protein